MKKLKKLCVKQLSKNELGRLKGGQTTHKESFEDGKHVDSSIDDSNDPIYA